MKNIQVILLIMISLSGCTSHQTFVIESTLNNGLESGACYYAILQKDGANKENPFTIELVSPKYEKTEIKYSDADLDKYSIGNGKYRIPKREPHFKFVIKEADLSEYTIIKNPIGYMYCMVEVPSEFFTLTKEELQSRGYKLSKTKIVQQSKIIKRHVKKEPIQLKENQYYFEGGYWSKLERAITTSF